MVGNYGFSHHQRGQTYPEVVKAAEAEQSVSEGLDILQSALDQPAILDTSKGTLGIQHGEAVVEFDEKVGTDSFPLPVADANQ